MILLCFELGQVADEDKYNLKIAVQSHSNAMHIKIGYLCMCPLSSFCCDKTDQNHLGEEKGLFEFKFRVLHQGRDMEVESEAETMEGCCLLACSPWLVQLLFLNSPGLPA